MYVHRANKKKTHKKWSHQHADDKQVLLQDLVRAVQKLQGPTMIEKHALGGLGSKKYIDQDDEVVDYFRYSAEKGDPTAQVRCMCVCFVCCMYMCVYAHLSYVCICLPTCLVCVSMFVPTCGVCMYVCMYVRTYVCRVYMYMSTHTSCMYICFYPHALHVCMYVCMHVHVRPGFSHTCMHAYVRTYAHMYIHTYIHTFGGYLC
jgi:hypothetical protein